ncbi:peptidase S8/S53 domain-containing protein [Phyllosticta capitalensis]|uniref:Peptidase S8/S53 domain-containing protein n=1 Tax=Phyllosticta capitalensis TaxID=121624 RepID=A0ABR1Y975_9PEZI
MSVLPLVLLFLSLALGQLLPDQYVVKLKKDQATQDAGQAVAQINTELKKMGMPGEAAMMEDLKSNVFNGVGIEIKAAKGVKRVLGYKGMIESLGFVEKVWPERQYQLTDVVERKSINPELEGVLPDVDGMTGVDKLKKEGISGKGVVVGIVDTGCDYLNSYLGGGFGDGFKVKGGFDFVGVDSIYPPAMPKPDPDPYSDCEEHGTHVAGIVAAEAPADAAINFTGVAPGASLRTYRVFDCDGITRTTVLIRGVIRAYNESVDIINLSLGGGGPFPDDPLSDIIREIHKEGKIFVAAAAGNSGANGSFTSEAPAAGPDTTAIGAVEILEYRIPVYEATYTVGSDSTPRGFNWRNSAKSKYPPLLDLYPLSLDTSREDEACEKITTPTPDLSNRLVLVRRAGCNFGKQMFNLAAIGARYILIYNDLRGDIEIPRFSEVADGIEAGGTMTADAGRDLIAAFAREGSVRVTMNTTVFPVILNSLNPAGTGGRMANFSTIGPPAVADLKQTVSSPGRNILSTVGRKNGGLQLLSGTSMACPYIAGVVALIKEARPGLNFYETVSRLVTTAIPMPFNDGGKTKFDFFAPVWQQGGGLVDAYHAVHTTTVLDTYGLSFNDTEFNPGTLSFTIINNDTKPSTYNLSHAGAATILSFRGNGDPRVIPWQGYFEGPLATPQQTALTSGFALDEFVDSVVPEYADLIISETSFTLEPKENKTIRINADISKFRTLEKRCPLVSGYIVINGTSDNLTLPYGAIGCRLRDLPIIDENDPAVYVVSATNRSVFNVTRDRGYLPREPPDAEFRLPKDSSDAAQVNLSVPWIQMHFTMYAKYVSVDLHDAETGKNVSTLLPPQLDFSVGRLNTFFINFTGVLDNDTWAPEGRYYFNMSATRLYGNPNDTADFKESISTDPFVLKYL